MWSLAFPPPPLHPCLSSATLTLRRRWLLDLLNRHQLRLNKVGDPDELPARYLRVNVGDVVVGGGGHVCWYTRVGSRTPRSTAACATREGLTVLIYNSSPRYDHSVRCFIILPVPVTRDGRRNRRSHVGPADGVVVLFAAVYGSRLFS